MNIEELKWLAEAATPGPWMWLFGDRRIYDRMSDGCRGNAIVEAPFGGNKRLHEDMSFIAAANPAAILELIRQRDELLTALRSYRSARAMPSYGDYASIQWESQQGPTNPVWGGGDCKKHGRWYGHCHCCASDWDKLKKQSDQDAVHARDNALRKADTLAAEAIKKIEG